MLLKNFSDGYRTNNRTVNSLSAGKNVVLANTPFGLSIFRSLGNALAKQVTGETVIGGFDYEKGDVHYHLIFTKTDAVSKVYLYKDETLTPLKENWDKDVVGCNAVNFANGVFITNGIDSPIFYEYGVGVTEIDCTSYTNEDIRGLAVKVFDNRIFLASGSGLFSCGLGDVTDWNSADVETTRAGYIKNFMNKSSTITGIEIYKKTLMIHRTTDTVTLSGTSGSYEMSVISNVGAVNPFSIANLDDYQMYFLKHINGVGLYYISANQLGTIKAESEISSFVHEEFANIDGERLDEIRVIANTDKNEIWIHLPRTDYPSNAYWLIYSLTNKCFYPPRITQPITSAWVYNGDIYIGTADGKILKEDYGKTFDGTSISFSADSCSLDFDTLLKKKIRQQCRFTLDGTRENDFILSFIHNDIESSIKSYEIKPTVTDSMFWSSGVEEEAQFLWGANWASNTPPIIKKGKPSSFRTLKIRFSGESGDIGLIDFELPEVEIIG